MNEKRSQEGAFREQQLKFNTEEDYDAMEVYLSYNGLMAEIASNIAIEDVEKYLYAYSRAIAKITVV